MLKISDEGLERYKDNYYEVISYKVISEIEKISMDFQNKEFFDYLRNNMQKILIGKFDDLVELIEEIEISFLKRASVTYQICKYLICTRATNPKTIKERLYKIYLKCGIPILDSDINELFNKGKRLDFIKTKHKYIYGYLKGNCVTNININDLVEYQVCKYLYGTLESAEEINPDNIKSKLYDIYTTNNIPISYSEITGLCDEKTRINFINDYHKNTLDLIESNFKVLEEVKKVFKYNVVYKDDLRHTILNKIGINICPYCGRQFISSYDVEGKKKASADLDHFFSKDKYPYLALSLFNFIPSCHLCNSTFKRNKDFYVDKHLYPYIEGFEDDVVFDIDDKALITDVINGAKNVKIVIKNNALNREREQKVQHNIETFKLESVYQNHKKEVTDIFRLIQVYNPVYVESIARTLSYDSISDKLIAQKSFDLMNIVFEEKGQDEILNKLHNDILNKYWIYNDEYKKNRNK